MDDELLLVADFIKANRKPMATYVRTKMLDAGGKSYVDRLGKEGIRLLDNEAAGVLLDLACAMLRRIYPKREFLSEDVLARLPDELQKSIRLPRSEAYHQLAMQSRRGK